VFSSIYIERKSGKHRSSYLIILYVKKNTNKKTIYIYIKQEDLALTLS